jgi:hypothetical protein
MDTIATIASMRKLTLLPMEGFMIAKRNLLLAISAAALLSQAAHPANAQSPLLVDARHLDQVENPSELDRWRKVLDTQEVRAIGDAITTYYGCVGCYSMVGDGINEIVPLPSGGEEHKGVIQAPVGYTVCRAYVKDPSVNCDGTFTGSYRTADDPNSANLDGLHYYIVVPTPAIGAGRCWVDGTVVVEFALASPGNRERLKCAASGTIAFHYGK